MKIEAETATISPGLVKWPMLKWFFVKGCISHEAVIKMPHVGKNVFSKLTLSLCNLHKKLHFQGLASCISRRENSSHTGTSVASCYTTSSSTGCFKDYRFSIHQCTRVSGRSHKWYTRRIKADNIYVHAYRSKSIHYWDMTGLGNFHSRVCVVTTVNIGEQSKRWVNGLRLQFSSISNLQVSIKKTCCNFHLHSMRCISRDFRKRAFFNRATKVHKALGNKSEFNNLNGGDEEEDKKAISSFIYGQRKVKLVS